MAPVINENKEEIISVCKKYSVKYLYAFGSAVRGTDFNPKSYVDLLYAFDKEKIEFDKYADNYFSFRFVLGDLLKQKIDMIPEDMLTNPYLIKAINQDKVKLYG